MFVVLNPVALQHQTILLLKRPLPVMFLLLGDVCLHLFDIGRADGEHAIAVLPMEVSQRHAFLLYASGRMGLHFFH